MALKATIFKAELQIADMGRGYYHDHALTLARHPSENDERMMMRVLAFVLHASDALTFAQGMNVDDEPDLWQKDLTGVIDLWIEVGQPDEKRVRKACGRAKQVFIYTYSGRSAEVWWGQIKDKVARMKNLTVIALLPATSLALAGMAQRSMQLQCTVQDGQVWVTDGGDTAHGELTVIKSPETG